MPTENTYGRDGRLATKHIGAETDDETIAGAMDKARLSSTAGAGLGSKGKALTSAPKQEPGESPSAYGERIRKYRETMSQQKAFGGK